MTIWQADFYRRPLLDDSGAPLWELVICDRDRTFETHAFCPQSEASSTWIVAQLKGLSVELPSAIQVFRPQALSLIKAACQPLGVDVEPTRHTAALKALLNERSQVYRTMSGYTQQSYDPLAVERPAPVPLPEALWGDRWQFAAIPAGEFVPAFQHRPIPIRQVPDEWLPVNVGLSSSVALPGVVIEGGRQAMRLARWLQDNRPVSLHYIPGEPDGLILEAGLADRWVLATFIDPEAIAAAQTFRQRLIDSKGLHFLLVQPDDSGMTYTGLWLLRAEAI